MKRKNLVFWLLTVFVGLCSSDFAAQGGVGIADPAYRLLADRVTANRNNFYVYRDADSGFNHGFPSGFFGDKAATLAKLSLDAACIDDPGAATGCSSDRNWLDRTRGTVLQLRFAPLAAGEFVGVNIEDPENLTNPPTGVGYDMRGATTLRFDVRAVTRMSVQFGVGGCVTEYMQLEPSSSFQTLSIALNSLRTPPGRSTACPSALNNVHILFGVATDNAHAPNGGILLLDNIRFEPVPTSQQTTLSFPLGNETFGVVPLADAASGRVPFPSDQVLRNLTTIYESAIVLQAFLRRGAPDDLRLARILADAFVYALQHDNRGLSLPPANNGGLGLHSGYSSGDIGLLNDQRPPKAGQAGDVRLAGFSVTSNRCGGSKFCLVLDGATGGNNAFAILALVEAYREFADLRYLDTARSIGKWIIEKLTDTTGAGFGGYYLGYDDGGMISRGVNRGKSIENNADIFAAFMALAAVEAELGDSAAANLWVAAANVGGDFALSLFDSATGCFFAGTVPFGTPTGPGLSPTGARRGDDVINVFKFVDSNSFTILPLAASPRYRNRIDWRQPAQCMLNRFAQTVNVGGQTFRGFNIVESPTAGPNGIAWEFTGQVVLTLRFVDALYQESRFAATEDFYLNQLRQAQVSAPFTDGRGIVASTMENGDMLTPLEQCLSTPFQCIPGRVGLAATVWAIFAERNINPFQEPLAVRRFQPTASGFEIDFNKPIEPSVLNLYDSETSAMGLPDLAVVGRIAGLQRGSLTIDRTARSFTFVKTGGVLPADTYMVTLRSAPNAFRETDGSLLDGDGDGFSGGDYTTTFTIAPSNTVVVSMPDFSYGPGQTVNVPFNKVGLPINLSNGAGVSTMDFTLSYDPNLLTLNGVERGADTPEDTISLELDVSRPGSIRVLLSFPTPVTAGPKEIVRLTGFVPRNATYKAASLLAFNSVTLNEGDIEAITDDAVHAVAYIGDTTGNGGYSSLDGQRVLRVVAGLDSGLAAYPLIDPVIIGDSTWNGTLSSLDATRILQEVAGLDRPEIPPIPAK